MFRNYITVALRNLVKHRLYSAINIVGLAVGLATAMLILLLVRNETSYDSFVTDSDRIYQVVTEFDVPGRGSQTFSQTNLHWGPAYQESHPELEAFTRVTGTRSYISIGEKRFYQPIAVADANFLDIFDFPLLAGERSQALTDPSAIVLTAETALRFFGTTDVVGRTVTVDRTHDLKVTAVLEDLPPNTHLEFEVLIPVNSVIAFFSPDLPEAWGNICCSTYLKFREGAHVEALKAGLKDWIKRRALPIQTAQGPIPIGDMMNPSFRPLTDIHTNPLPGDPNAGISMAEILTLVAVAVLVLAIASINFMNLATARATQRAREVSIRKVVGASRNQIVLQFIGESVVITLFGLLLAVALAELALPAFNGFIGKNLSLDYTDPMLVAGLLALAATVGVVGGSYPAFFLSAFNPAKVLKGEKSSGGSSGRLRMALVVVQFAISITLMVATAVVYGQFLYAQNKDLGFDKDNVIVVGYWTTEGVREHRDAFMETLRQDPGVVSIGLGSFVPGDPWENNTLARRVGDEAAQDVVIRNDNVGFDYFKTLGMRIIAGRDFDRDMATDPLQRPEWQINNQPPPEGATEIILPASIIVNRTGAAKLGFASPEAALGQQVRMADSPQTTVLGTIIGVVEDFHFRSIHEPILPSIYIMDPNNLHAMAIRVKGGLVKPALKLVEQTWTEMIQDRPFDYAFLDQSIQRLYEREKRTGQLFATFSGLAILIACLGLFGLASFTAERRTKEIGLRKVLGADVRDIVRLLVWQFSKPVLIANIIAWPIAWFGMSQWLESFAYRIDLNPLLFVAAGSVALLIAWATVAVHAIRVAQANPVHALRYE